MRADCMGPIGDMSRQSGHGVSPLVLLCFWSMQLQTEASQFHRRKSMEEEELFPPKKRLKSPGGIFLARV